MGGYAQIQWHFTLCVHEVWFPQWSQKQSVLGTKDWLCILSQSQTVRMGSHVNLHLCDCQVTQAGHANLCLSVDGNKDGAYPLGCFEDSVSHYMRSLGVSGL